MKKKNCGYLLIVFLIALLIGVNTSKPVSKTIEIERTFKADGNQETPTNKTSIEIVNVQKDTEEITYTYKVTINSVAGAVKYSIDGAESYATFDAKGSATFNINSNQRLVIYDIPYNTYYNIEQISNDKYVTSVQGKKQTKIDGVTAQNNIVTFTNTNKVVSANPNTSDNSLLYITTAILSIIALIVLIKTIKVKRFTNN